MPSFAVGGWGIALDDRDPAVRPGDNFYMSQNGAWFARSELNPRNPSRAYWRDLQRLAPRRALGLLRDAAAHSAAPESAEGKAGAFYRAFMDEKTIEEKRIAPLRPQLLGIQSIRTPAELAALMGRESGAGTAHVATAVVQFAVAPGVFDVGIRRDVSDPSRNAVYVSASGLLLPGPEFYSDPQLSDIRKEYEKYIVRILSTLSWPDPEKAAREIIALETRIGAVTPSHEQRQDARGNDTVMSVARLAKYAPGFDWHAFFLGAELGAVKFVHIDAVEAFPKIAKIVAETPISVWQARQAFAIADIDAVNLNDDIYRANFEFRGRQFNSAQLQPPARENKAWVAAEAAIGDALGALYVAHYFSPEAKRQAQTMAEGIRRALDARLAALPWMSAATKTKARAKLAAMKLDIGYPETFQSYRGLVIDEKDHYGNLVRSRAYAWHNQIRSLDKPVDESVWPMTPQMASYFYAAPANAMGIPAGTLEPPFFDLNADPAVNYGAIGSLMGQQMFGALDDLGRHYDARGRVNELLTPDESRRFGAMRQAISDQYSAVEPLPGIHIKGDIVANEAIDDLGGLLAALDAYHASLGGHPAPVIDGFTGDQRFFLGRAQMWRAKFAPPFVRAQLATGSNAPPFMRVNGPLRHMDAWYAAFNVQPGDSMFVAPERRVRLW